MIGPLGYPYPSSPAVDKDILRYTNQEYTKLYDAIQDFVIRDGYNYKRIEDFGAKPETGFDNTAAFAEAVEWANAETNPAGLIFGPGIWEYDESPNWAVDNFQILANGAVRLRYSGTGDAFIIDGGAAGAGITNMFVGRFLIEAHDGAGDGVYIRAVHRSFFSFNVRGCGTTQAALRTEWCVIDEFQFTTSVNEGGWYNDGSGAAKPLYGAYLDKRGAGEATSYCTFLNPIIEGTDTGCLIQDGIGNNFYGGTMEACTNIGLDIGSASLWNKCYGADFEANTNHDIYIQGDNNHINGSDTLELITVISGAQGNQITGGSHSQITINSGASATDLSHLTINRFGDASTLTDNGTGTHVDHVYDFGNDEWIGHWDDLRFPVANLKAGASGVPTWDNTNGLQEFSIGDYLFCQVQLPHAWKIGSTLKPHVHWCKITSAANLVRWQIEYKWAKIGQVMDAAFTTIADETPDVSDGDTAYQHALTALPDIVPAGDVDISDMLIIKISRVATVGASYGTRAVLFEFDIHIQTDTDGSLAEFEK